MYENLNAINTRPGIWERYTADTLWTDEHISRQMLAYHLNGDLDLASRNTAFIDRSVAWMSERFNITKGTRVIDFGCGPGLYGSRLAARGAEVTGVDFSLTSIEYARKTASDKGLDIDYSHRNYLEYETGKQFDLIAMIYCDLCPLNPEQRKIMLRKFSRMLADGGHILLDVCSLNLFEQHQEAVLYEHNLMDGFWSANDYYGFRNSWNYPDEHVTLDKYTIIEEDRTREVFNWLQCYDRDTLRKEFEDNGLSIIEYYADVAGTPYDETSTEFAIVAVKS